MKVISGLIAVFITTPIWYWLIYQILERVQATQLMWFLYWVYFPFGMFANVLACIAGSSDSK